MNNFHKPTTATAIPTHSSLSALWWLRLYRFRHLVNFFIVRHSNYPDHDYCGCGWLVLPSASLSVAFNSAKKTISIFISSDCGKRMDDRAPNDNHSLIHSETANHHATVSPIQPAYCLIIICSRCTELASTRVSSFRCLISPRRIILWPAMSHKHSPRCDVVGGPRSSKPNIHK